MLSCPMSLEFYPRDGQSCLIDLASCEYSEVTDCFSLSLSLVAEALSSTVHQRRCLCSVLCAVCDACCYSIVGIFVSIPAQHAPFVYVADLR